MSEPRHLLVVDDDPGVQDVLRRYFVRQAFQVSIAASGAEMRAALARTAIDLVLLDLGLPGEDGLDLTRELHGTWRGPVIIITGRGDTVDRVVGLEVGADDYVTKPLDLRELLARVRSVLRRSARAPQTGPAAADGAFEFSGFRLDPLTRTLSDREDREVNLTTGEYELLYAFLDSPNRVLTRDQLLQRIHGRQAGPFDRAIDVQIARLRRKIEADPTQPELIKSVRGAGYVLTARVVRGPGE